MCVLKVLKAYAKSIQSNLMKAIYCKKYQPYRSLYVPFGPYRWVYYEKREIVDTFRFVLNIFRHISAFLLWHSLGLPLIILYQSLSWLPQMFFFSFSGSFNKALYGHWWGLKPKPRYGPSSFSFILSVLLKEVNFDYRLNYIKAFALFIVLLKASEAPVL